MRRGRASAARPPHVQQGAPGQRRRVLEGGSQDALPIQGRVLDPVHARVRALVGGGDDGGGAGATTAGLWTTGAAVVVGSTDGSAR